MRLWGSGAARCSRPVARCISKSPPSRAAGNASGNAKPGRGQDRILFWMSSSPVTDIPTTCQDVMQRFIDALMLKGTWKPKPFHVVLLAVFLAYQGWMASPYFMHYVVGAPDPGSAPRRVGKLRVEGELRRTGAGWTPPRYFLETRQGDVEFHCGYLPYKRACVRACTLSFTTGCIQSKSASIRTGASTT
jgi:hypothetical protein